MSVSLAAVNRALRKAGHRERLARGPGYFYFRGGDAERWPVTGVHVSRVDALSIEGWLAEHRRLKERAGLPGPDITLENHGSIWLLRANTDAARVWTDARFEGGARMFCGAVVVAPENVAGVAASARVDGLTVEGV